MSSQGIIYMSSYGNKGYPEQVNSRLNFSLNRPSWLSKSTFEAETSAFDKVNRVANNVVFGGGLYGLYSLALGGTGLLAYTSYLSMGLALRKITSTAIGYLAYPAALSSFLLIGGDRIGKWGNKQIQEIEECNFIVRKVSLYKSGTRYDAMLITHPETITNGNWTINALGNGMVMEFSISNLARENFSNKCNTLLVNGPSVSQSGGWPTRYQMGAGFEAGIQFLEREVKATHIIMRGLSLGGGMMGEAILNHDFSEGVKNKIRYLSITDRSFSSLSTIAGALVGKIVEPIFYLTGAELDGVAAARKLSQLGIRQIIIQHSSINGTGSDDVIPDRTSLAHELHKDPTLENKIFLESPQISHNGFLPTIIENGLNHHINNFLAE